MRVAIIGSGNVGKALGGTMARAGHDVVYAARDAEKTRAVAAAVGASAADSPADAARSADAIVLAVPYPSAEEVARSIADQVSGKLVVDVTNPLTPDFSALATSGGPSAAEQLAEMLPGARVAKAFNTLFAGLQAAPDVHGTILDVLYATDDDEARATLTELIGSTGFRAVDAGPLEAAREMEALAWLNMRMQMRFSGDWRSSFVSIGAPAGAVAGAPGGATAA